MPMYNRRQSRFKRRRFNPRKRLKVMKYSKISQRRPSRVPAARYGLFYDMMRKYMAASTIGRPNIAQKTMSTIVSRKNNLFARQKMKMEGFRVSRFCLVSFTGNSRTHTELNKAGLAYGLGNKTRNFPPQGEVFPTTFNLDTTQWMPGTLVEMDVLTIHPQWPGSRLHTFENRHQGNPSKQPEWGLLVGNQQVRNDNFNFNTKAVDNVKPYLATGNTTIDNLETLYRCIKVYKTTLTLEFFNASSTREVDIHIVHFRYVDFDTSNGGTCAASTDNDQMMNNLLSGEYTGVGTDFYTQNCAAQAFEYCMQHKKLPTKNYITKSWKTITLGRNIETQTKVLTPGTGVVNTITNPLYISKKPYRKVTFKYGMKTWNRTGCIQEGSFINDQTLIDRTKLDTQVMVFFTINKNYGTDNYTHMSPATSAYDLTQTYINFRFWKTNLWRESN